jgi:hypothetical protein
VPAGNTHINIENSALGCMYTGAGGSWREILLLRTQHAANCVMIF